MRSPLLVVTIVLAVASVSASAAPSTISAGNYRNYSCNDLLKAAQSISARAMSMMGWTGRKSAGGHVASTEPAILVPPDFYSRPLSRPDLVVLRKRLQAIQDASIQSECQFEFVSPRSR